jgi:hypothetical protein
MVEVMLTHESRETVSSLLSEHVGGAVHFWKAVPGVANLVLASREFDCGPVELTSPGDIERPRQVFGDALFPDFDHLGTGRPLRLTMIGMDETPPTVWELGGYEVGRDG